MSAPSNSRSLDHPLPAGMRDLLPEEAAARRLLAGQVLERLALHGYAVVTPPVFEFAEVLERGLGVLDPADVLRFVEPESGEVAALRPDMTPQVARIIATRLRERVPPFRLSYEGTVLRRRSGRARKHRQIPQVGAELAGVAGPDGDLELIALAASAVRVAGIDEFTIDIGDAGIVRGLLAGVPAAHHASISEALARKDPEEIARACALAGAPNADALTALPSFHGRRSALEAGVARLWATPAREAAERLLSLFDAAVARGLAAHLTADLAEVRGFAYYTGTVFHAYAPGTGDAIGSGGRYDELLGRFGWDLPAAGFALDLDRVFETRTAGVSAPSGLRVVVLGPPEDPRLRALRSLGIVAVGMEDARGLGKIGARESALAWARSWGFTHLLCGTHVALTGDWVEAATGASIPSPLNRSAAERAER